MQATSILIVDDHPVYRDALQQLLSKKFISSNITVHTAESLAQGLSTVKHSTCSWIVLLDLQIPDSEHELSGIKEFKQLSNVATIAAISGLEKEDVEQACLDAGCALFISKNSDSSSIYESICNLVGHIPNAPEITQLTGRQQEILRYVSEGHSNKMIAYSLQISEQTVKIHLGDIFKKLKVFNRTQAVIKAKEHGWS
jgi:DNA-binding NarL/FixJ family response regulator